MRRAPLLRATVAVALAAFGCTNEGENRITGITGTGQVTGFAVVDANGSRVIDAGDDSLPGVKVRLALAGRLDTGLVQTTQSNGSYRFVGVPVGLYTLKLDTAGFADTLQVVKVDSQTFTVGSADTVRVNVLAGLPLVTVRQARALPQGRRVFVTGVALDGAATFADSTAQLADTSGSIRLVRVRGTFAASDSLRVRATTGLRGGQPTLEDPTVFALGPGRVPAAATLTTAAAASAAGGARDAQLVVVHGAIISDTSRTATSFVLTVSDGSGSLGVQLDQTADAAFQTANLPGNFVPGNRFDLVGVLAPTGTGSWRLRPRTATDLTLIPPPVISIAAARALPAGQIVNVVGVALNGSGTFADTTIFLADTSGAIRLTRLRTTVAAGDSVKARATTASRNGEPTLDGGTTTPLGTGFFPTAPALTTAAAASAAGGTRDAQLVIVHGAIISDTARTSTSFVLTASDSSGALEIELDRTADVSFQPANLPADFVPGTKFDVLGVLAPTGTGTWRLRPRSAADLTEIPLPVISIAKARTLAGGQRVVVVGVALNGSTTFSDSTVHLADTSGAIRLTRLRATVAAGDSVRVRATTASRAGQPTLDAGTTTALGQGLFPTAPTLTTATAATAAGGTRDAQLVVVNNATITDTATVLGSYKLTVSDGSGSLEVLLDQRAGFVVPGLFVPSNKFNIVGVLAPTGTGSSRLKPRSATDLQKL
ncbi:MAG: carboxypeptidase-like regulatory domain-containing protein [Gemmatimonadales bacterium]